MVSDPQKRSVETHVFPAFKELVKTPFLRRSAIAALNAVDDSGDRSISIVVADNATLHSLNLRYRGFDEPTDVLSFGEENDVSLAGNDADKGPAFPDLPDELLPLGEIVLSYPLAVQQAGEHNVTVQEEVALLVIHGVLHLLGHDHATLDEEAAMKVIEARALTALSLKQARPPKEAHT